MKNVQPLMDLLPVITAAAERHGLRSTLVAALVYQESAASAVGVRVYAYNPEPRYEYLWDVREGRPFRRLTDAESLSESPPSDFPSMPGADRDAEWWGQQASWGLGQLMGAVAREHGFDGVDIPELCDPELNLRLACQHLAWNRTRTEDETCMLAAYNGGLWKNREQPCRNASYAASVLEHERRWFDGEA